MKEYINGKIIYKSSISKPEIIKDKVIDDKISGNWSLIDRKDGISNIIDDNLSVENIYLSEYNDYEWKIVGTEKSYHINILEMDFKYKMLYAQVKN